MHAYFFFSSHNLVRIFSERQSEMRIASIFCSFRLFCSKKKSEPPCWFSSSTFVNRLLSDVVVFCGDDGATVGDQSVNELAVKGLQRVHVNHGGVDALSGQGSSCFKGLRHHDAASNDGHV